MGAEKTWCGGVDCATGAEDVCQCAELCLCWWGVQWRVWSEGWCSPRLGTQPAVLHHCAWSLVMRVPLWGPLGGTLCLLVTMAELLEECVRRLLIWKEAMEEKGLRVNAGKMITICGMDLDLLLSSGEFPCTVCHTVVGSNSIFCNGCKHWMHKKCSGLKCMTKDPDYRCTWCQGTPCPLEGRPQGEVQVRSDKLEVVASFFYLGDVLSVAGSYELWTATRVKTAWKKFKELLPVLSSRHLSFKTRGSMYSSCVRSEMLHASKTWPLTKLNRQCLQQNDRAMLRQVCNVKPQNIVTTWSNVLLARLGIWGSGPHSEGEKATLVWTYGTLQ